MHSQEAILLFFSFLAFNSEYNLYFTFLQTPFPFSMPSYSRCYPLKMGCFQAIVFSLYFQIVGKLKCAWCKYKIINDVYILFDCQLVPDIQFHKTTFIFFLKIIYQELKWLLQDLFLNLSNHKYVPSSIKTQDALIRQRQMMSREQFSREQNARKHTYHTQRLTHTYAAILLWIPFSTPFYFHTIKVNLKTHGLENNGTDFQTNIYIPTFHIHYKMSKINGDKK